MSKKLYIKRFNKKRKFKKPIFLKDAPVLHEFMQKLIEFSGYGELKDDITNNWQITGMCKCGSKNCATVTLKRDKDWDEELKQNLFDVNTSKGLMFLHFENNGLLELEALMYNDYPYKDEIKRVLKGDFSPTRRSENLALKRYFRDLKSEELNVVVVD